MTAPYKDLSAALEQFATDNSWFAALLGISLFAIQITLILLVLKFYIGMVRRVFSASEAGFSEKWPIRRLHKTMLIFAALFGIACMLTVQHCPSITRISVVLAFFAMGSSSQSGRHRTTVVYRNNP